MKKWLDRFRNEKGALSFEFLGILPFFFLFFIILWQVVASGYAIYTIKTAANEGAKTFAMTQDVTETEDMVKTAIGNTTVVTYKGLQVVPLDGSGKFEIQVKVAHPLIFIPNNWKEETAIDLEETAVSQVLVQ